MLSFRINMYYHKIKKMIDMLDVVDQSAWNCCFHINRFVRYLLLLSEITLYRATPEVREDFGKSVFFRPVQSRYTDVYSALDFARDVDINYVPYVILENESFDCNYNKYTINANHSNCNLNFFHWRKILVYFINEDLVRKKAALKEKMFPNSICVVRYIYWIWQNMIQG